MDKTAVLFSGQGAQVPGMMKDIYDNYEASRNVFLTADEKIGRSVSELTFNGEKEELNLTHNTQPCMLAADLAAYEKLFDERKADLFIGIKLWQSMMPEECVVPAYARKYISFFEHGQATTEAEARNLFDLFLHHERMENMSAQQLAAIQAGNAAIVAAANRAADAADATASAARDLNLTANYIRAK